MSRLHKLAAGIVVAVVTVLVGALALPSAEATPAPVAVAPPDVSASEWACLAVAGVDLGLCLENPVPDLGALPTVPELLGGVLSLLG